MSKTGNSSGSDKVVVIYDEVQHCTAFKASAEKNVAMDCPYTGKGVELSPTNMVEAALGGCILMAMGALAVRNNIDISGAQIEVEIKGADVSPPRFGTVDIVIKMPRSYEEKDRIRLERAADACPIKHSFMEDIPISVDFVYP